MIINKNTNLETLLENLLQETQPIKRPESMADFAPVVEKPFSLDQAIDRYLIQYERESIPTSKVFETVKINKLVKYLFEQDVTGNDLGDLDLGDPTNNSAVDDASGSDIGDNSTEENKNDQAKPVMNTPKINLQDFVRSVARLVNNIGSLIDLKTLILNRAEKYIQSNYDKRTGTEMMEILDTTYDLRPVDNEEHSENSSKYPDPTTAVTGPVGG